MGGLNGVPWRGRRHVNVQIKEGKREGDQERGKVAFPKKSLICGKYRDLKKAISRKKKTRRGKKVDVQYLSFQADKTGIKEGK